MLADRHPPPVLFLPLPPYSLLHHHHHCQVADEVRRTVAAKAALGAVELEKHQRILDWGLI